MSMSLYRVGLGQVKAHRAIQACVTGKINEFGIGTPSEWFVLNHLHKYGPARSKDLAAVLEVEPPLIVNITDILETKKLIRKKTDRVDKRVKKIDLTEKATQLIPVVEEALLAELNKLLEGVDKKEIATYSKVLEKIIENDKK